MIHVSCIVHHVAHTALYATTVWSDLIIIALGSASASDWYVLWGLRIPVFVAVVHWCLSPIECDFNQPLNLVHSFI